MPSLALTNAHILINGVTMSAFVRKVGLSIEVEDLEDTAMGDEYRSRISGLKDYELELEFNQDFAASAVDATVQALVGSTATFEVKPVNATTSATNPKYSGTVLVTEYPVFDTEVGELATVEVTWPAAGALTRATS